MPHIDLNSLTQWITTAAVKHPKRLHLETAAHLGVTRRTAHRVLAGLVEAKWLVNDGSVRYPNYRPGALRQVHKSYDLPGLSEDVPWLIDFAPYFALPPAVTRMVQHTFCELMNNANDHSGGSQVTVSLRQTATHAQLMVTDNGCGLFQQIEDHFAIPHPRLAMLELSKGKLTSRPDDHCGQGLFITSKLADVFGLHANDAAFQRRASDGEHWRALGSLKQASSSQADTSKAGTSVFASFALDTPRTLTDVRTAYSLDGLGASFDRTVVPLRLLASDGIGLESRAQARRVASRLNRFRRAEVDFGGVADIGQAFADELFRVLARNQPDLDLVPVNMSKVVSAMIGGVTQGLAH